MCSLVIGEDYRLFPDGLMTSHIFRLIDVTERGLFYSSHMKRASVIAIQSRKSGN